MDGLSVETNLVSVTSAGEGVLYKLYELLPR